MENIWFQPALWMALALVAAIGSLFITISAALFEIVIGATLDWNYGSRTIVAGPTNFSRAQTASLKLTSNSSIRSAPVVGQVLMHLHFCIGTVCSASISHNSAPD